MNLSSEDKTWIYIGVGLAATGGLIYWYKNKDNGKKEAFDQPKAIDENKNIFQTPPIVEPGREVGNPQTNAPATGTAPTTPAPITGNDQFMYSVGQRIMCNTRAGLDATDVQQMADGSYFTKNVKVKKFEYGKEIGKVVAVYKAKGFVFYIVTGIPKLFSDSFDNRYYWVQHRQVKGIVPLLKTQSMAQTPTLDTNKLLKKGIKGAEVGQLQKMLNIGVDGDFGKDTEAALFKAKKVKQITIATF